MKPAVKIVQSIKEINADEWNSLAGEYFPFARYEFLYALENNNAVGEEFGWLTNFFLAYNNERLVGALPAYIKYNSYGEFVFDWAWADAYHRNNIPYYPKLVTSIPYTPATGPRLLIEDNDHYTEIADALVNSAIDFAKKANLSSYHCLFKNPLFK